MRKSRLIQVLKGGTALLALGGAYLWFFLTFGVGIPCVFNKLTGLQCPGCGMTRAIAALWKGNVDKALGYNALVLSVFPVLCLYLLYRIFRYIGGDEDGFHIWEYILLIPLCAAAVGYGILRNLV